MDCAKAFLKNLNYCSLQHFLTYFDLKNSMFIYYYISSMIKMGGFKFLKNK